VGVALTGLLTIRGRFTVLPDTVFSYLAKTGLTIVVTAPIGQAFLEGAFSLLGADLFAIRWTLAFFAEAIVQGFMFSSQTILFASTLGATILENTCCQFVAEGLADGWLLALLP
jgi:hypothetical protein